MAKKILGLDLGTNSIGWALVEMDWKHSEQKSGGEGEGRIIDAGCRIIPMSQDVLSDFDKGNSVSQTAERTRYRSMRRLHERYLLRRQRLHRVLNCMGFLPEHYVAQIDFAKRLGQFLPESEPKLAWTTTGTGQACFLFEPSFNAMLEEFKQHQPELLANSKKIPYDWTLYYLRKKALTQRITKEELAWVLLSFNQKRGYNQLRGEEEEEENPNKQVELYSLKVVSVEDSGDRQKNGDAWYNVLLENGWVYRRTSKQPLDWVGKVKDFIVTTDLNDDGTVKTDKEGKEKRSFRAPDENDWTLRKKRTEQELEKSKKTVGTYIYDALLQQPDQKIRGLLIRTVDRSWYKDELKQILEKQKEFHPELNNDQLYAACLQELYPNNTKHVSNVAKRGFTYLLMDDVLFYQRPLKSKKSLIDTCGYEPAIPYKDPKDGSDKLKHIRCIPVSHPLFQEFRLWQWVQNLKIRQAEKITDSGVGLDTDVTDILLPTEDSKAALFDWLNDRKEVDQKALLKYLCKPLKLNDADYRWNYVYDEVTDKSRSYPCNETRAQIASRLAKVANVPANFLTPEVEETLWLILYSVSSRDELLKALQTFARKHGLGDDFVEQFKKFPPFDRDFGAYSAKAIKKLLPLMRMGKYWSEADIDAQTKQRIQKLIDGEFDENIGERVREKTAQLRSVSSYKALPLWMAGYVVYGRHAETGDLKSWKAAGDLQKFLTKEFKQHSLRNPIVEQVVAEALRVVHDIWVEHGNGEEGYFDEIHVELGREMKNPAQKRKELTFKNMENESTNLRIKALLTELLSDAEVENVRPYSPSQQELLKLYEEGVLAAVKDIPDDMRKISRMAQPTSAELKRYKLWLEQLYRSPYTGETISLTKLFTPAYQIEHVIPQSRYFDDSLSNKVICEAEVNDDKGNCTGYEYIKKYGGKQLTIGGKKVNILKESEYTALVQKNFSANPAKKKKLLMEDIPESFIERQLNDSRYISKVVANYLSNIVRGEKEMEAISKNVVAVSGGITAILRQDWGLNNIWNELVAPRFERLNTMTNSSGFGAWTNKDGKRVFQTEIPTDFEKGFQKKRIDHRHHILDALVIACISRNHVNYLNNQFALEDKKEERKGGEQKKSKERFDLKRKLRLHEKVQLNRKNADGVLEQKELMVAKEFWKPWHTYTQEVRQVLQETVVSFKQNLRVINKTTNRYQAWRKDESGQLQKVLVKQAKGDSWAIRKPLHQETVVGPVTLREKQPVKLADALENWRMIADKSLRKQVEELIGQYGKLDKKAILKYFGDRENRWNDVDISKVEIYVMNNDYVAYREALGESFTSAKIRAVTDGGIQKILLAHLRSYNEEKGGKIVEHPELAFSPDGIDELNRNIVALNDGKPHQPIRKVRTYEIKGNKFNVGQTGNKQTKFVVAAKGTNLFYGIYVDKNGKRSFESVPLNVVIERQKQGLPSVPELDEKGNRLLFQLSPNDLVYVPTPEEQETPTLVDISKLSKEQCGRIYKVVSFTGSQVFFVPCVIAKAIADKVEFNKLNKIEISLEGVSIRRGCWKLSVNRLGKLTGIIKE